MSPGEAKDIAVMVSRPGERGEELTSKLQQQGYGAWHIPTLKIIAEEFLIAAEDFQQAIFISPNAVKLSIKNQAFKAVLPDELIAVGPGTAASLRAAGFARVVTPAEFNSEGLLKLPQLNKVAGQHILIVKGRGGRPLLGKTLTERGAICHYLEVYGRVTEPLDEEQWEAFFTFSEQRIVTSASVDALKALNNHLGKDFDYGKLNLLVASQRIKENAQQFGYRNIMVAKSATNDAMLAAIAEMAMSGITNTGQDQEIT